MTFWNKRFTIGAGIFVGVVAGGGWVVGNPNITWPTSLHADNPAAPCVVAMRWVEDHPDEIPATLAEYRQFDAVTRKAIFNSVPVATTVEWWEVHLEEFLENSPDLTDEQVAFVLATRARLMEYATADRDAPIHDEAKAAAIELFGKDLAFRAFVQLGGEPPVVEGTWEDCNCSGDGLDFCGIGGNTQDCDAGAICDPSMFGCGWLNYETCLGLCIDPMT